MTVESLPAGIRLIQLQSGETRYLARVHRAGMREYNQRFATLQEAIEWRNKTQVLLDSGVAPDTLTRKYQRKQLRAQAIEHSASTQAQTQAQAGPSQTTSFSASQGAAEPSAVTVDQAINAYLKHRQASIKPLPKNYVTDYERVRDDLTGLSAATLRNEDLVNYIRMLQTTSLKRQARKTVRATQKAKGADESGQDERRTYSPASIRKFIYALKIALEWNVKNRGLTLNPHLFSFDKGQMPAAWSKPRERRLRPGEEERLYAAGIERGGYTYTQEDWRRLIGFALETAMREQEIALARWQDIYEEGYKLLIPAAHSKTKTSRTVLLSQRARDIIERQRQSLPRDKSEPRIFFQFPGARAISFAFARLRERAGIEDLTFHDLRHEATSRLCESGKLPQMAIMEMTGHSSLKTFKGYVHLIKNGSTLRLD